MFSDLQDYHDSCDYIVYFDILIDIQSYELLSCSNGGIFIFH